MILNAVTMYTASNPRAGEYGKPQMYDMRIWDCGSITVAICTDQDDCVAMRTAWRPRPRPSVLGRLRRFLQNLL